MAGKVRRLTHSLEAVIEAVMAAPTGFPAYGLWVCEKTGLGPGTVYPILERLVGYGWIATWQEPENPHGRPRRRYYGITSLGRTELAGAREIRDSRRRRWTAASQLPGSAHGRSAS